MLIPRSQSAIALVLLMLVNIAGGAEKVSVDGALAFGEHWVYLIEGQKTLMLRDGQEFRTGVIQELGLPGDFPLVAASTSLNNSHMFFYGTNAYYDRDVQTSNFTLRDYTDSLKGFFVQGGPDAVAWRDGKDFYFKGCYLATHDENRVLKQRNAKKLGLPCSPDAAWSTGDKSEIVLLKGDHVWLLDNNKQVDGPHLFRSLFNMTSWELMPR